MATGLSAIFIGGALAISISACGRIGFDDLSSDADVVPESEWLRSLASDRSSFPNARLDAAGNTVMSSCFEGTVVVDGGGSQVATTIDSVLVSYDSDGDLRWNKFFSSTSRLNLYHLFVLGNGDSYLTGVGAGTLNIGGDVIEAGARQDVVLARFDTQGEVVHADIYTGGSSNAQGHAVAANASGTMVLAGTYGDNLDLGGGSFEDNNTDNGFVASLDVAKNHRWSRGYVSTPTTIVTAVDIDSDGISCIGGHFEGPIDDFGDGQEYDVVSSNRAGDAFVAQYDEVGALLGLAILGSQGADRIGAVKRIEGGCIAAARICGTTTQVPEHFGLCDGVIARVATDGTQEWSIAMGSSGNERVEDLAIAPSGAIFFAGSFAESFALGRFSLLNQGGGNAAFWGTLTSSGEALRLETLVGEDVTAASIAVSADERAVVVSGLFRGEMAHAGRTINSGAAQHTYVARIKVP